MEQSSGISGLSPSRFDKVDSRCFAYRSSRCGEQDSSRADGTQGLSATHDLLTSQYGSIPHPFAWGPSKSYAAPGYGVPTH